MWLVDKKYEFSQDGRRLEIIVKFRARKYVKQIDQYLQGTQKDYRDIVSIMEFAWRQSKGARLQPVIRIIVMRNLPFISKYHLMGTPADEAIYGNILIGASVLLYSINERRAEVSSPDKMLDTFVEGIEEEIAHIYMFQKNIYLRKGNEAHKRLQKAVPFRLKTSSMAIVRHFYLQAIPTFQLEGTAGYCLYILKHVCHIELKEYIIETYSECDNFLKHFRFLKIITFM